MPKIKGYGLDDLAINLLVGIGWPLALLLAWASEVDNLSRRKKEGTIGSVKIDTILMFTGLPLGIVLSLFLTKYAPLSTYILGLWAVGACVTTVFGFVRGKLARKTEVVILHALSFFASLCWVWIILQLNIWLAMIGSCA